MFLLLRKLSSYRCVDNKANDSHSSNFQAEPPTVEVPAAAVCGSSS
jgi:hypothetical protein